MEIKAKLNYLRTAPRKVRLIADLIRGLNIKEAEIQLRFNSNKVANPLLKLLNSAVANAKNSFNVEKESLFIKSIKINQGPPFKRWRAASRGRAMPVLKKTSHVDLVLGTKKGIKIEKKKETKSEIKEEIKEETKPKISKRAPKKIEKTKGVKGLAKKVFRRKAF